MQYGGIWIRTNIKTSIKSGNEINAGWEDECHVVSGVYLGSFEEQRADPFGALVELGAGHNASRAALGVE